MHEIQIRAKSLEEARKIAAFQLGVSEEEIEIEVVQGPAPAEGTGGDVYLVRARLKPDAFSPPSEEEAGAPPSAAATAGGLDISRYTLHPSPEEKRAPADEEAAEEVAAPQEYPEPPPAAGPAGEELGPQISPGAQQVADNAVAFLDGLMRVLGLSASAEVRGIDSEGVHIELSGDDLAFLIGRYGSTLDALQLLTAAAANRGVAEGARVILDAEGYRQRRRASLEKLARSTAAKVRRTGQEIAIPHLRPHERRIVHMALRDDPDVETYSEGEGSRRRLVVAPRRHRGRGRRR